jgi:arabinan endo-1,5-alpha-L-arabinosidase
MHVPRTLVAASILLLPAVGSWQAAPAPVPTPPIPNAVQFVHDPCIVKAGAAYYVYATGPGIPMRRSTDLLHWEAIGRVFDGAGPDWIRTEMPQSRGIWAPDVSFYGGRYHLLYAVSSFGSNRSVIGAASNKTLDPASKEYRWIDEGKVFESNRQDNYNAIDPNILPLDKDRLALTFGSFWSGIKLVYLDARTGKPAKPGEIFSLARRPSPDAIEAPFLIRRGRYYYLFVSFDYCCRGVNSTYNVRVGRSEQAAGPYVDRDGRAMLDAGGTQLVATEGNRIGPGHCAVLRDRGKEYLAYHFYDGRQNGIPTLQIAPMTWTPDGWPVVGKPLGGE